MKRNKICIVQSVVLKIKREVNFVKHVVFHYNMLDKSINKKQHNDVNKSIQGLGSSKDFYTYLTAILLLISVFARVISEGLSLFLIVGALVFWVIGLKKTTNLILHLALAILAFVIFITTIVNY